MRVLTVGNMTLSFDELQPEEYPNYIYDMMKVLMTRSSVTRHTEVGILKRIRIRVISNHSKWKKKKPAPQRT
jgi:hypothetical protein